jgi:hypothetical protein
MRPKRCSKCPIDHPLARYTLHNELLPITCRNRHCPKCQANARDRWLEARSKELLPTPYVHVVFTLPRQLVPLALQNKREIYGLLFRASAETLIEVARDPKRLGAEIGFFSVLHAWNQKLRACSSCYRQIYNRTTEVSMVQDNEIIQLRLDQVTGSRRPVNKFCDIP